jgi:hypothetical protein
MSYTPPRLGCVVLIAISLSALGHQATAQEEDVCSFVARMANQGRLAEIRLPKQEPSLEEFSGGDFFGRFDINDDGVAERVYVVLEGAGYETLYLRDGDLKVIPWTLGPANWDKLRWASGIFPIRYGDEYYVVGLDGDKLYYVGFLSTDFELLLPCEFEQTGVATRVISSRDDAICEAALGGELVYVPFDKPHAIPQGYFRPETGPTQFAAETDVDNDGAPDVVIGVIRSSGAGRGCESRSLAILDESRTGLAGTPSADLLLRTGGTCNGVELRPFRFGASTYLELKYRDESPQKEHKVFKIHDGQRELICEIEARVVNVPYR